MPSGKYKLLKHQHSVCELQESQITSLIQCCAYETYGSSMPSILHTSGTLVLNNFHSKHHFLQKIFKNMCLRHKQKSM